ncbi:unnamed protein product [Orchesella dallaii]|uniref:Transmembrane protein n=1 Tax=Orchesella dallaii TaxID=48710 RepID=A0ABP1S8H7_9HEXA
MVSHSNRRLVALVIVLVSIIFAVFLVWILYSSLKTSADPTVPACNVNSTGTSTHAFGEYTYNSCVDNWVQVIQNKSSTKSWGWGYLPFFIWMVIILIIIFKYGFGSNLRDDHVARRREDWASPRPVVAISTVSRDYNIGGTGRPSAPPHTIVLPPSEEDATPPEYLPPPSYNDCVINMDDNYYPQASSSLTRIV